MGRFALFLSWLCHADAIVYSLPVTFFQKVSVEQFDVAFEALLGVAVCIRFTSISNAPDSNAFEVCSGMYWQMI